MKTIVFKRWLTLLFSVLAMLTAGSLFTFSAFSKGISDRFGYTSANLNIISGVGLAGLYVPFLFLGPLYDFFGRFGRKT